VSALANQCLGCGVDLQQAPALPPEQPDEDVVPASFLHRHAEFCFPRYVLEEDLLPMICIRCGEPAVVRRAAHVRVYGIWLHILGLCARKLVFQTSCFVVLPFCGKHKNHWTVRILCPILCLIASLALIVASILSIPGDMARGLWPFGVLGLPAALVLSGILHYTSIHPVEIGEDAVVLCGVSPKFLEALKHNPARSLAQQEYFGGSSAG
jgi:hypothetical protein